MTDTTIPPIRPCTQCKREYPRTAEFFVRDMRRKDGLAAHCKVCAHQYYVNHIDELRERGRVYGRQYRVDHLEKRRADNKEWAKNNPDKRRAIGRNYAKRHPEKFRINANNRAARKRQAEGKLTTAEIEAQAARQRNRCHYCNCIMTEIAGLPNSQTIEHAIPITRGGRNSADNLVIACDTCNKRKNNRLPHEWPEGGRLL